MRETNTLNDSFSQEYSMMNKSTDTIFGREFLKDSSMFRVGSYHGFLNTYSDLSTPSRSGCGEAKLHHKISKRKRIRPKMDIKSQNMDTKRARSYSNQK